MTANYGSLTASKMNMSNPKGTETALQKPYFFNFTETEFFQKTVFFKQLIITLFIQLT